jgi:hypothetical protein
MRVIENTRQAANLAVIGLGTTGRDDTALHNQTQLRLPLEQWLWVACPGEGASVSAVLVHNLASLRFPAPSKSNTEQAPSRRLTDVVLLEEVY